MRDITPQEIKSCLTLQGITQVSIAKKLGVSPALVSMVIHGKNTNDKVRQEVARIMGRPVRKIWKR